MDPELGRVNKPRRSVKGGIGPRYEEAERNMILHPEQKDEFKLNLKKAISNMHQEKGMPGVYTKRRTLRRLFYPISEFFFICSFRGGPETASGCQWVDL